jgi:hypothetical protein
LWNIWHCPFMALHDLDFIMYQYAWKLELHDKFWWKSITLNFNNMCETACGLHGNVNLWSLCTRCYYISICFKIWIIQWLWVEVFHTVCVIHGKSLLWAYVNQVALWINMAENQNCSTAFRKVSHVRSEEYLPKDVGTDTSSQMDRHDFHMKHSFF